MARMVLVPLYKKSRKFTVAVSLLLIILHHIITKSMRALFGQSAMVYCASKLRKNHASSELLYKSNRPQVFMVYRLINHLRYRESTRGILNIYSLAAACGS